MKVHFLACHRKPERSFFFKGRQFPVCARCTGILIGYFIIPFSTLGIINISIIWCLVLITPTYLDGIIQAFMEVESTNSRRFLTGLLAGIGQGALVCELGKLTGKLILNLY
ncbi:MAG: DUF2085 domain-containing protein [Gracilimonas sp.]